MCHNILFGGAADIATNPDLKLLRSIDLATLPIEFYTTELLRLLDARLMVYDANKQSLTMQYTIPPGMLNGADVAHGGTLATILDQTMVNSLFLADKTLTGCASINMNVTFSRPIYAGSVLVRAQPRIVGSRVAQLSAECSLTDAQTIHASAICSVVLFRDRD